VLGKAGKRVVVLAAPGDRRDEDILGIARRAAASFDHFICRRDDNPRGRGADEVPRLLARGLAEAGVSADQIQIVDTEEPAVDLALSICQPGDLLLVFADKVTRTWKQIIYHGGRKPEAEADAAPVVQPAVAAPTPSVDGLVFVRDERGVIAITQEEAD
jgi:cyanophycin synthetase